MWRNPPLLYLPPDLYQESAQEVFNRMSPQERMQFGDYLRQQAQQQNYNFPDINQDGVDDRPGLIGSRDVRLADDASLVD